MEHPNKAIATRPQGKLFADEPSDDSSHALSVDYDHDSDEELLIQL